MYSEAVLPETMDQEGITRPGDRGATGNRNLVSAGEGGNLWDRSAEAAMIQSALGGNLSAFNHLIDLHQDTLYWWVFSLVKDAALADDITQTTFIKAYEKLNTFRGGSFKGWLFTIARNHSYDELRKKKRYPSVSLDDSPEDDYDQLVVLPDRAPLPEDALIAAEHAAILEQLLNRLPDVFQQVMRLVDIEGLDYQEAAAVLSLPLGTMKSRLTRARLKMRHMFQESGWQ